LQGSSYSEASFEALNNDANVAAYKLKHPKFHIDKRVILLKLKTIRFARLKAIDLAAVSYTSVKCKYVSIFVLTLRVMNADHQAIRRRSAFQKITE
jgi:hypothetical protein